MKYSGEKRQAKMMTCKSGLAMGMGNKSNVVSFI